MKIILGVKVGLSRFSSLVSLNIFPCIAPSSLRYRGICLYSYIHEFVLLFVGACLWKFHIIIVRLIFILLMFWTPPSSKTSFWIHLLFKRRNVNSWKLLIYNILLLEEGHCVISNVCFMRSSAALVYNCKQARIVLAGTSFATTKALAFQRSA